MADLSPEMVAKGELAEEVVYSLDPTVARFVFDQGVLHLQALQVASHALDGRATQVATILFAAAALAATSIGTTLSWSNAFAVAATAMFVWGGLITFRVLRSDDIRLPGVGPAWWQGATAITTFTEKEALAWAAKLQQLAIESICRENDSRAVALNASLNAAVGGAVLVALAVAFRLQPEISKLLEKL